VKVQTARKGARNQKEIEIFLKSFETKISTIFAISLWGLAKIKELWAVVTVVMETIPLRLLLYNYMHSVEHNTDYVDSNFALQLCYTFRPVVRPSSVMSIQKSYKGRCNKM